MTGWQFLATWLAVDIAAIVFFAIEIHAAPLIDDPDPLDEEYRLLVEAEQ